MADPRELWIAGRGKRNVEDARRKAAANTPQVMMSQTPEWYTTLSPEGKRENLSRAKDVLQHMPAVTTDQNESRNMYQMLMNQMKGGDRGARMMDTSGLPAGARRIGRTLFTDPAKSQGFFGDVGSLFSGKNKAAVRAKEYNPFPKAGFGEQFYKDEFPIASSFGNLMGLAEKSPTLSMIASLFPKKERIPLERDPRFSPVDGSADWESSVFDPIEGEFEEEIDIEEPGIGQEDFPFLDMINQNPRADSRIEKYIRYPEAYPEYAHLYPGLKNKSAFPGGFGDEFFPAEPEEAVIDYTGIEDDYVDLDEVYVWSESGKQLQEAGKTVTEIVNDIMNPLDPNYDGGWDRDELIEIMIKKDYIKKKE